MWSAGGLESAASSPSGVWGGAPAEIEFGAFLALKSDVTRGGPPPPLVIPLLVPCLLVRQTYRLRYQFIGEMKTAILCKINED